MRDVSGSHDACRIRQIIKRELSIRTRILSTKLTTQTFLRNHSGVNNQIKHNCSISGQDGSCCESKPQIFYIVNGIVHDIGDGFHDDLHHEHDNDRLDSWIPPEVYGQLGNRICSGSANKPAGHTIR